MYRFICAVFHYSSYFYFSSQILVQIKPSLIFQEKFCPSVITTCARANREFTTRNKGFKTVENHKKHKKRMEENKKI